MSRGAFLGRAVDHPEDSPAAAVGAGPETQINAFVGGQVEYEINGAAIGAVHGFLHGKASSGAGEPGGDRLQAMKRRKSCT
jgi:hypothetical protein